MVRRSKLFLGILLALMLCALVFSMVSAQDPTPATPAGMPTATLMSAITTQDIPADMTNQSAPAASTPYPQTTTGSMPMGSGMTGMNGAAGMNSMGTSCPMMGQMGSGSMMGTGMTGMNMAGTGTMGMTTTGMPMNGMTVATTGTSGMTVSNTLYDADGRLIFWNLNPWWLLGWVILALITIGILFSAVFGVVTLIRRTRRPVLAQVSPDSPK